MNADFDPPSTSSGSLRQKRPSGEFNDPIASGTSIRSKLPRLAFEALDADAFSHPAAQHSRTLCVDCSKIDIDAIFATRAGDIPRHGRPVSTHRKSLQSSCQLCGLVASLLDVDIDEEDATDRAAAEGWHLRVFSCAKALRIKRRRNVSEQAVILAVMKGSPPRAQPTLAQINASLLRGFITPILTNTESFTKCLDTIRVCGNEVNQLEANFSLIRQWLEQDIIPKKPIQPSFRCQVIDCYDGKIVQHDPSTKYLTLSYVWGKSGKSSNKVSNPLVDSPQTVQDAIQVTLRLGERYLWVDRYCVPEDGKERHLHIANMNLIYEGAFATIVAANPGPMDGPDLGLYGVSKPRNIQKKLYLNARTFVSTLPHVSYHIDRSVWATRGWTYQEAVLSTRCLFFTPDQVYYASKRVSECESVQHSLLRLFSSMHQTLEPTLLKLEHQLRCNGNGNANSGSYGSHLFEYAKRSLTFDLDILDAFRGILAKTTRTSYWGIPISFSGSRDTNITFAKHLCWTVDPMTREVSTRRTYFPSWSWTSVGALSDAEATLLWSRYPHARFAIELDDGTVLPLSDLAKIYPKRGQAIPERNPFLHVTSWLFKAHVRRDDQSQQWSLTQLQWPSGRYLFDEEARFAWIYGVKVHIDIPGSSPLALTDRHAIFPALYLGSGLHYGPLMYLLILGADTSIAVRVGLLQVFRKFNLSDSLLYSLLKDELVPAAEVTMRVT
ncbi:hypothetical protein PV08_07099 [Exophiala spinifera]|uniref:Heterokaryon incompatibility domain-containing protein n=1 Tax=Exophiala spinifera TaxID=91928 RepID=A0A0D1ZN96_9EURO|nr:uncharacterized protein PV08_07099 [Exophiala spinifera]KIW14317.1 hypothetical protein PV08_07099 [Exophiala spinifera]